MTTSTAVGRSSRRLPRDGRILAGILAGLLVAGSVLFLTSPAHAAEVSTVVDGMTFTADDGDVTAGATVTDFDDSSSTVIIPDSVTIGGTPYAVTAIGDFAFANDFLTSVTIPDSVLVIGDSAFAVNGLTSVTIPDSVTTIGAYAFEANFLTPSVTIPDSVTTIGEAAFYANVLVSVTIPDSVTDLGRYAFGDNELTSVSIPDSVTTIRRGAFEENRLTSVAIPDSVTTIGVFAFAVNELTSVSIPDSVTAIGDHAFWNNGDLATVAFHGPPPTTFTAAGKDGSLGYGLGLVVSYPYEYDAANYQDGYTAPTWHGYATTTNVPVTFDSAGGSPVPGQTVVYGDLAPEPEAPTRTGYDFVGWYADGSPWDFSRPVTGGLVLTAHWKAVADSSAPGAPGSTPAAPVVTGSTPAAPAASGSTPAAPAATESTLADSGSSLGAWPLTGLTLVLTGFAALTVSRRRSRRPRRS